MSTTTLPRRNTRPNGRNWPLLIAALIITGGSAKTSTISMLATILALRGYKVRVFDFDQQRNLSHIFGRKEGLPADQKNIWDLIHNKATLDEATLPARYRVGTGWGDEAFEVIPNLAIVPGSHEVKNMDTEVASNHNLMVWFEEICALYDGDDDVWLLDLPASLSKLVVTALIPFQQDDEVLPPVLVTNKEEEDLKETFRELKLMIEAQTTRMRKPAPTIKHIVMCGTPTPGHADMEGDETVEALTRTYGENFTLHRVRWSKVIRRQHRLQAPAVAYGAKGNAPTEDYNKIVTALGFPDLNP